MAGATPTPTGCGRRGDMWAHVPGIEEGGFWVLTIVRRMQYGMRCLARRSELFYFFLGIRRFELWMHALHGN
jgi:hypothetical protein